MDDEHLDKLLRAQHAATDAMRAVLDVIAVSAGIAGAPTRGTAVAGFVGVRDAARTLRETARILEETANLVDGLKLIVPVFEDTHDDEGR